MHHAITAGWAHFPVWGSGVQVSRSAHSLRAEAAYRGLASTARRFTTARMTLAKAFSVAMHEHWLRDNHAYSNAAIGRLCGVDEKTVRQWRSSEKPIPATVLVLLPTQLYDDVLAAIAASRGVLPKRALIQLRKALSDLRSQIAHEDKGEVTRALLDAQSQIAEILRFVLEGSVR
jgi:hypothetical protein